MPHQPDGVRTRRNLARRRILIVALSVACSLLLSGILLRWLPRSRTVSAPPAPYLPSGPLPRPAKLRKNGTVALRLQEFGGAARARLLPSFHRIGIAYPPGQVTLVGLKQERRMEVYVTDRKGRTALLGAYPILAASGHNGPKLREGDCQVPEGVYRVTFLNSNSRYHVSLRLNYPNPFDRAQAEQEGRSRLGGDIMIHGSEVSIGCLAMGDVASEDLFTLAADTGQDRIRVVLSPVDFRVQSPSPDPFRPAWVNRLYADLKTALLRLPGATG